MKKILGERNIEGIGVSISVGVDKTEDILHRLAFQNSCQPNLIFSVIDGRIISANAAACQLLKYSDKDVLSKYISDVLDTSSANLKKMLKERAGRGQSSAIVTAIKKGGELFTCQITSGVFSNDGIELAVMTLSDMSQSILKQKKLDAKAQKQVADNIIDAKARQKKLDIKREKIVADNIIVAEAKSDARLAENNEWIRYIAKTSYDVMWDWDIATGEIYVGDSVEEVFGYKVQNNTVNFSDFLQCLPLEEQDVIEQRLLKTLSSDSRTWSDSYLFKRYDDSLAFTTSRASIVRDEDRKALRLIGATQDISRLQELETKLEEQTFNPEFKRKNLRPDIQLSFEVLWHWNIVTKEVFTGEEFEPLFGYAIKNNKLNINDWYSYIHPDDKEGVQKSLDEALASSAACWQYSYRLMRANNSIANVFVRASIFKEPDGKPNRMIGVLQDRSLQQEFEDSGVKVLLDKKSILIDKIKNVVTELVLFSDEVAQTNYSALSTPTLIETPIPSIFLSPSIFFTIKSIIIAF